MPEFKYALHVAITFFEHLPHDTKEDGIEGIYRFPTQT